MRVEHCWALVIIPVLSSVSATPSQHWSFARPPFLTSGWMKSRSIWRRATLSHGEYTSEHMWNLLIFWCWGGDEVYVNLCVHPISFPLWWQGCQERAQPDIWWSSVLSRSCQSAYRFDNVWHFAGRLVPWCAYLRATRNKTAQIPEETPSHSYPSQPFKVVEDHCRRGSDGWELNCESNRDGNAFTRLP